MIFPFISKDMTGGSPVSPTERLVTMIRWDFACVCATANCHFCLFSAILRRYYILHVINTVISLCMTLWASLIGWAVTDQRKKIEIDPISADGWQRPIFAVYTSNGTEFSYGFLGNNGIWEWHNGNTAPEQRQRSGGNRVKSSDLSGSTAGITYLIPQIRAAGNAKQRIGSDRIVGATGPSLRLTGHPIVDQQAYYCDL